MGMQAFLALVHCVTGSSWQYVSRHSRRYLGCGKNLSHSKGQQPRVVSMYLSMYLRFVLALDLSDQKRRRTLPEKLGKQLVAKRYSRLCILIPVCSHPHTYTASQALRYFSSATFRLQAG